MRPTLPIAILALLSFQLIHNTLPTFAETNHGAAQQAPMLIAFDGFDDDGASDMDDSGPAGDEDTGDTIDDGSGSYDGSSSSDSDSGSYGEESPDAGFQAGFNPDKE